jgi:uncharacterized protein
LEWILVQFFAGGTGMILQLLIMHAVGTMGGLLARKARIPAGALIGSLITVIVFNALTGSTTVYPDNLRVLIQICSGLVIGCRFTRADIKELRVMFKPVIVLVVFLLLINLVFAYIMAFFSELSLMTAFFACAPGGISDLVIISGDFGADPEQVALLQLFRFVFVVSTFPPLMKRLFLKDDIATPLQDIPHKASTKGRFLCSYAMARRMGLSFLVATIGGICFYLLGIPAGPILGAITAIIILNLATDSATYPRFFRTAIQILAGCYIGGKVTLQTIMEGSTLLLPLFILIMELFVMAFLTAFIIYKTSRLDFATALFSSTPGGITEMGIISEEMGLDTPKIVLMHTIRIIAVLGMLPFLVGVLR